MSKNRSQQREKSSAQISLGLSTADDLRAGTDETILSNQPGYSGEANQAGKIGWWSYAKNPSHWWVVGLIALLTLGATGAGLKYLDESAQQQKAARSNQSLTAERQETSLLNSLNPFLPDPTPAPTPQLSKEYIYAGSRMISVVDANATEVPPADLAVWRPSTGYWYVLGAQGSQQTSVQWGSSTDTTVPGDYDGDGKTDFSVFRPSAGAWYIVRSSDNSTLAYSFGQAGDTPTAADFDGDGKTDAALFRPDYPTSGQGTWLIQRSSDSTLVGYQFGIASDKPAPADFDGDGKADLGVWRNGDAAFYYSKSSTNYQSYQGIACGQTGDSPVAADYDGDGRADAAVRHGSDWVIKQSSDSVTQTIAWQYSTDKAVQNDYDGDGKVDIAVWRDAIGYWLIRQSSHIGQSNELRQVQWGASGDIPVPAFYRR
jgi:hypothetical protein